MRAFGSLGRVLLVLAVPLSALGEPKPPPGPCDGLRAQVSPKDGQTVAEGALAGGVFTPTLVTLNGQSSKGDAFLWEQVPTGAPAVALAGADQPRATFTAPSVGRDGAVLTFRLTVTQTGCDRSASVETTVTVTNTNRPPVAAVAVSPETIFEGDAFTLDGRASTDPDGDALGYLWEQLVDGAWVALGDADVLALTAPEVPWPDGATLTFRLTVSDGALTGRAERLVNVLWENAAPTAVADCPAAVDERGPVDLDGSRSADDVGVATYAWTQLAGGPLADVPWPVLAPGVSFQAPSLALGHGDTMTFGLEVGDAQGQRSAAQCDVRVRDVTPPAITVPPSPLLAEATSSSGAVVTFAASATDAYSGDVDVACAPASGTAFALDAPTLVTCRATDGAGNEAATSFTVSVVDTTPPDVTPPADVTTGPTRYDGAVATWAEPSAEDLVDGAVAPVTCVPASGSTFGFGETVVTCSARDAHGNVGSATFTVTVTPFAFAGFFQPVDASVTNTVRNGATVPFKFQLRGDGGLEITDVRAVTTPMVRGVPCTAVPSTEDALELTMTGGTSLRYDATAGQFVFNWKTPSQAGTCWRVEVSFTDGAPPQTATFKLK